MQKQFSGWYASMSFQQDAELTEKRFAAIESHVEGVTTSGLSLLARLAFRLNPQMGSPEVAALRQKLAGNATQPGDDELTMLSASALAVALGSNDDAIAALTATVVTCMSCGGLRHLEQPMDLVGMAGNVLRRLSETARRRPSLEQTKFSSPTVDKNDEVLAQALQTGDMSKVAQAIATLTNKALSSMARRQREFEGAIQKYVNIQDEELDILWWLEGNHSFDLALDFPEVASEHLALAMAKELGGLTKVLPGPPALSSLLSRTGLMAEPPQSLPDAIQRMPREWLDKSVEGLVTDRISPALTPILFALQRRHEVHGEDQWIAAWCTTTGLSRAAQLAPLQLAVAAYREFTLARLG
ncbi:GTPase-associated system all-helical protein GASH [Pseudorhodoferax sp. Leaf267]|uniref:GTPase-associated system all-helical protein GASH n=1 Tax=Pseudorhodoferax sp. Leaf267 TaxID=1736316 RepID=UPI0006FFE089|nr:GTPase-associated system all-helical protein GASH [Pseudorhodoferax sp. Leaf267]KQP11898.1 hypothetical protein ASF43_23385 [Pseudorhodoferax sp. Leaf267]